MNLLKEIEEKNPYQPEFIQAVKEVAEHILPYIEVNPKYKKHKIFDRMAEPERVIIFRVAWLDDAGEIQINRGYRVQMNSAIGPYKGGLRFHPTVNLSILKFLAFEQTLKNSLTGLPMGGAKGGSDFNPKGKSDNEVMRFCQSFMTELYRHIGHNLDVPAGDIGVGKREIAYMFGQYKKIKNEFTGVLTGKGLGWGGSKIRPEATGYGLIYFIQEILKSQEDTLVGKVVAISGSGNVAQYAAEKSIQCGAKVVTLSDSEGFIYDETGITAEKLAWVIELKEVRRGRIKEYLDQYPEAKFFANERPWKVKCDIALPCATENELDDKDAKQLIANGCKYVGEGANMPSTSEAVSLFNKAKVFYVPGKAANAGGVAVSGLEMTQNSLRYSWFSEKVDDRLHLIMKGIHDTCVRYGKQADGHVNYEQGANIGGFVKVADAMIDQGVV
ncbi:NADP-specific glutamate dehydrogenase [Pedobacter sp. UBA4863]|uniref:NADP-specific glutamate dehydrogenase n=1 Tax=Pedobacter sp. UBA4863 TaxID=1947060 RepID=UPI0025CB9739|nr:NADP-specific glutamate dehydrogenase [Pedobacter sp. UBA4863]